MTPKPCFLPLIRMSHPEPTWSLSRNSRFRLIFVRFSSKNPRNNRKIRDDSCIFEKMDSQRLLDHLSSYVDFGPKQKSLFLSKVHYQEYPKGDFIQKQGQIAKYNHFVISGCLKTFYLDANGNEYILSFAVEDWWCGDLESFITQTPGNYHTQCIEDVFLARIAYEDLELLYIQLPELNKYFRLLIQNAYVVTQRRIIDDHRQTATEKYKKFRTYYPDIDARVPQYMIASYLGITPEFLSKIRKKLMKEN